MSRCGKCGGCLNHIGECTCDKCRYSLDSPTLGGNTTQRGLCDETFPQVKEENSDFGTKPTEIQEFGTFQSVLMEEGEVAEEGELKENMSLNLSCQVIDISKMDSVSIVQQPVKSSFKPKPNQRPKKTLARNCVSTLVSGELNKISF